MTKRLAVLLSIAAMVSACGAYSGTEGTRGQTAGTLPAASLQTVPSTSTTLRMDGVIDSFDAATRVLSLGTASGPVRFDVKPGVRIREGWQSVGDVELAALAGRRVTIRYAESGSGRVVQSVHVLER